MAAITTVMTITTTLGMAQASTTVSIIPTTIPTMRGAAATTVDEVIGAATVTAAIGVVAAMEAMEATGITKH